MLEYKSIPFEVKEVVDLSGGGWVDLGVRDPRSATRLIFITTSSCRARSPRRSRATPPKFLFEHAEPIGKTIEIREDDHGLYGRWSIVDTRAGTDAYKLAQAGVLDSLSIGFFADEYAYREDGVRVLMRITLPEVSAVAIPANRNAVITDVKSPSGVRPFADHAEHVRVAVQAVVARAASGSDARRADGKAPLSDERRALVTDLSGSLRSAADELDAIARPPVVVAAAPPRHDFDALRARLVRLGAIPGSDPS
jgi:HK97 family phage prohead protease